jgi:hypothetical protein
MTSFKFLDPFENLSIPQGLFAFSQESNKFSNVNNSAKAFLGPFKVFDFVPIDKLGNLQSVQHLVQDLSTHGYTPYLVSVSSETWSWGLGSRHNFNIQKEPLLFDDGLVCIEEGLNLKVRVRAFKIFSDQDFKEFSNDLTSAKTKADLLIDFWNYPHSAF